jgi:hypothetical protein
MKVDGNLRGLYHVYNPWMYLCRLIIRYTSDWRSWNMNFFLKCFTRLFFFEEHVG